MVPTLLKLWNKKKKSENQQFFLLPQQPFFVPSKWIHSNKASNIKRRLRQDMRKVRMKLVTCSENYLVTNARKHTIVYVCIHKRKAKLAEKENIEIKARWFIAHHVTSVALFNILLRALLSIYGDFARLLYFSSFLLYLTCLLCVQTKNRSAEKKNWLPAANICAFFPFVGHSVPACISKDNI